MKRLVWGVGIKIIDALEEAFFEKDVEYDDGGVLSQQHFAVFVKTDHQGPYLDVEEMPWKPAAGHHYEIVRVHEGTSPERSGEGPTVSRSPEQTEETRLELLKRLGEDFGRPKTTLTNPPKLPSEETEKPSVFVPDQPPES